MLKEISDMNLSELAPYIRGEAFVDGTKTYEQIDHEMFEKFCDKLQQYDAAKCVFDTVEYYKDFYSYCPDFAAFVPMQQKEIFYAAKCGYVLDGAPMSLVYLIERALKEVPSPNLVVKQLPANVLSTCFKKGYLQAGYSLFDVICSITGESYTVLTRQNLKSQLQQFTEVYIPEEDMVALCPNKLANAMTDDFILSLHLDTYGLVGTDDIRPTKLVGYKGVCNSYYDLRRLI